jgi:uncharacterized phage-associated protein
MAVAFQFDFSSTLAAITFFASKNIPELTKYKLCKLIFLADKYHLVTYGRIITGDKYCALPYGPIPSRTLNLLNAVANGTIRDDEAAALNDAVILDRRFINPRFQAAEVAHVDHLSRSDVMALEKVIAEYGQMGFGELKAITHEMFAYKHAWGDRPEGSNGVDMDFDSFFEEDSDAVVGAQDVMREDDLLRKAFPCTLAR